KDNAGNFSAQSGAISVTTSAAASCTTLPSVPGGLSATKTDTTVSLSWTASTPGANCTVGQYNVFRGGTQVGTTGATNFSDSGLSPNTTFSYNVSATNQFGTSNQSSPLSVTTNPAQTNNCSASAWNSTSIYTQGLTAVFKGFLFEAKWWNQNT